MRKIYFLFYRCNGDYTPIYRSFTSKASCVHKKKVFNETSEKSLVLGVPGLKHKVHIYLEYQLSKTSRRNWDPPPPLPQASVYPPSLPNQRRGGGDTLLRLWGWESPNSDDGRKNLALCHTLVAWSILIRARNKKLSKRFQRNPKLILCCKISRKPK